MKGEREQDILSRETAHKLKNIFGTLIANAELLLESCEGRDTTRIERILNVCNQGVALLERIREDNLSDATFVPEPEQIPAGGHILVVEDEPAMLELETRILLGQGYRVTACRDANEAFSAFLQNPRDIDLLLTDQGLPGISGVELIKEIHTLYPELPCLLLTGDGQFTPSDENFTGHFTLLTKPVKRSSLLAAVSAHCSA